MEKTEEIQPSEKKIEIVGASPLPSTPYESEDRPGAALDDEIPIKLSWRSWVVVFVACFAYVPSSLNLCLNFNSILVGI
jgi:hypothetical protein